MSNLTVDNMEESTTTTITFRNHNYQKGDIIEFYNRDTRKNVKAIITFVNDSTTITIKPLGFFRRLWFNICYFFKKITDYFNIDE